MLPNPLRLRHRLLTTFSSSFCSSLLIMLLFLFFFSFQSLPPCSVSDVFSAFWCPFSPALPLALSLSSHHFSMTYPISLLMSTQLSLPGPSTSRSPFLVLSPSLLF